jgi:gamma-glutamylcyclotransferase (GGCT)/AIG2-like uncharacterized protein YtfP
MKNNSKPIVALILINIITLFISSCGLFLDEKETSETISEKEYSFDPNTILGSIKSGDTDLFIPITIAPESYQQSNSKMVNWNQSDYVAVAEAIFNYVWHDLDDGWKLQVIDLSVDCVAVANGPQKAFFNFYKIIKNEKNYSRFVRYVYIYPQNGVIHVYEYKITPSISEQKFIEIDKIEIKGDDAIRIVEQNGGADIRSSVDDECYVYSVLSPNSKKNEWQVSYYNYKGLTLFSATIDILTGKYSKSR